MRLKKTFIVAVAAVIALATYAIAQVTPPQVSTINQTDLIQIVPLGQPSAQSVYATPSAITVRMSYYKSTPASLFTFTFGNTQSVAAFTPAGTIAYGYVTFAPTPSDGTQQCIFTTQTITTFYLTANTGQTLNNAVTTLAANAHVCYLYGSSNLTWDRTQ